MPWWSSYLGRNRVEISEEGSICGRVFEETQIGVEFFDLVTTRFFVFDENNGEQNRTFGNDVDYITQCTINDITSKTHRNRWSKRIDAYLYIYRRIQEYYALLYKSKEPVHTLRRTLFKALADIFKTSNGEEPNLILKDENTLSRINISQYLSSITKILDEATLLEFFVLMKLSMQSAKYMTEQHQQIRWIDTLRKVQDIKFSLDHVVNSYLQYKKAFEEAPWDTSVLIYLIRRLYSPTTMKKSAIFTFIKMHQAINSNHAIFFEQFLPIFGEGIQKYWFTDNGIADILLYLSKHDVLFRQYFNELSSKVDINNIFNVFLILSKMNVLNDTVKKILNETLPRKLSSIRLSVFNEFAKSAQESLLAINDQTRPIFIAIFLKCFHAFLEEKMPDLYADPFDRSNYINLLNIGLSFPSTDSLEQPSNKRLIHNIVCKIDKTHIKSTPEKLRALFQNLKVFTGNFAEHYDPEKTIEDSWLKDFSINNLAIWVKIDWETYRNLCENHQNNRWTLHVWSRIMYLSLSNLSSSNSTIDVLCKLNDWMKEIKHTEYDPNDILTIAFIRTLFDVILFKYSQSTLSLPPINAIMNYVIGMRETPVNTELDQPINQFLDHGIKILKDVLLLKSKKYSLFKLIYTYFFFR